MKKAEILKRIDHTLLDPSAKWSDYEALAESAMKHGVAAVCVPPDRVEFMCEVMKVKGRRARLCTVVGFPNGYSTMETKAWEAKQAILQGAEEIDMVVNIGAVLQGDWDYVREEIGKIRSICCGPIVLKVIAEACYLNEAQKINLCNAVTAAKADYIKTSTGFGPGGATIEDVKLFRANVGKRVKVKAAGGISTIEQAKAFIEAGCDRLGSSKLVGLLAQVKGDEV